MTTDEEVISLLRAIEKITAPTLDLDNGVDPARAFALGAIYSIARLALDGQFPGDVIVETKAGVATLRLPRSLPD